MKIVVFLLSMFGYYEFLKITYRDKIRDEFIPFAIISYAVVTLYAFAMVNCLIVGLFFIDIVGLILLIFISVYLIKQKINIRPNYLIIVFLILLIWALYITYGIGLSHEDDSNHWYLISKSVFIENALPTKMDIRFPTYVPGEALWNYYVCKHIGFSYGHCLLAVHIIYITCVYSIFSISTKEKLNNNKVLYSLIMILTFLSLYMIEPYSYTLLVDIILGFIVVSLLALIYNNVDYKYKLIIMILGVSFLTLIKSSGILFGMFLIVLLLYNNKEKRKLIFDIMICLIPIISSSVYLVRSKYIYSNISNYSQAISIERYKGIANGKSASEIIEIVCRFIDKLFNYNRTYDQVRVFWIYLLALFIMYYCLKELKKYKSLVIGTVIISVLYLVFLLLTYIFSMSTAESEILVCYYRYFGTLSMIVAGTFIIMCILALNNIKKMKYYKLCLISFIVVILLCDFKFDVSRFIGRNYYDMIYTQKIWDLSKIYVDEQFEYNDESYVVIWNEEDFSEEDRANNIPNYLRTYLRAKKVYSLSYQQLICNKLTDDDITKMKSCDKLVILGESSDYLDTVKKYIRVRNEVKRGIWNIN